MRWRCIRHYFSDLFINMVRAGEASGSLGQIFERLSEFERSRDELRSYIVSSMIYPALLALVGAGSIFRHPEFRGAALRQPSSTTAT
jgi:type II secretory pathway component PulF